MQDYTLYQDVWREIFGELMKPPLVDMTNEYAKVMGYSLLKFFLKQENEEIKGLNLSVQANVGLRNWKSTRSVCKKWKEYADESFRFHWITLIMTVRRNRPEGVKFICSRKEVDPSCHGQLPLLTSIVFGSVESFKVLMSCEVVNPADPIFKHVLSNSLLSHHPLHMAVEYNQPEILQGLLKDPRIELKHVILGRCIEEGKLEMVKILLEDGRSDELFTRQHAFGFHYFRGGLEKSHFTVVKYVVEERLKDVADFHLIIYSQCLPLLINNEDPSSFPYFDEVAGYFFSNALRLIDNDQRVESLLTYTQDLEESCFRYITKFASDFFGLISGCLEKDKPRALKTRALSCLVDWSKKQPVFVRSHSNYLEKPLETLVEFICQDVKFNLSESGEEIEVKKNEESGSEEENSEEEDSEESNEDGRFVLDCSEFEELLDELCVSIGGKYVGKKMMENIIPALLSSSDYKQRGGGLRCLEMIVEGCPKEVMSSMPEILNRILSMVEDRDPRMRYIAVESVAILAKYLQSEGFVSKYHQLVFPVLFRAIQNDPLICIHNLCAGTFWNLLENIDSENMISVVKETGDVLYNYLTKNLSNISPGIFESISKVSQLMTETEEASLWYAKFVPILKRILVDPTTTSEIQGVVLDNISWIIANCKSDDQIKDATEVLEFILEKFNEEDLEQNLVSFSISVGRICLAMKDQFVPYMEKTIKFLRNMMIDTPSNCTKHKESAKSGLFAIAEAMKGKIFPFMTTYIEVLEYAKDEELYDIGRIILPTLFIATADYWKENADELKESVSSLIEYLIFFTGELEDLQSEMEKLKEITVVGVPFFEHNDWIFIADILEQAFSSVIKRRIERKTWEEQGLIDEEQEEKAEQAAKLENELVGTIGDIMTDMITSTKEESIQILRSSKIESYLDYLKDTDFGKKMTVLVFCDLVEFAKLKSLQYFPTHYPCLLLGLESNDHTMVQACSYAVGVIAQHIPKESFDGFPVLYDKLINLLRNSKSKDERWIEPLENAVNSLGKLLVCRQDMANPKELDGIYRLWLDWLPPRHSGESKSIFNLFLSLLESENSHLLGKEKKNTPDIIKVLGNALIDSDLTDESIRERSKKYLSSIPSDLIAESSSDLPEGIREALHPFIHKQKRTKN